MKLRPNEENTKRTDGFAGLLRAAPGDILVCLTFFTRLPASLSARLSVDYTAPMSRACQMFPLIGLVTGLIGALVISLSAVLQLPVYVISLLTVTAMILTTGALHEDGLADMVDGFGGGLERERKLEIMKDSHIGTYGVLALILSQGLRIILIASLLRMGLAFAIPVLIASQIVSRAASMLLWRSLPPARSSGLSRQAGQPDRRSLIVALGTAAIAVLCLLVTGLTVVTIVVASSVTGLVAYLLILLCRSQINGQTGDTIGATQQLCDLAFMLAVLICLGIVEDLL